MDLFERLRRVASQVDWGSIAGAMAENLGADTDAAHEVIAQLKEWGSHLTRNALTKWTASVMAPTPCDSPDVSSGRPRQCGSYAVVKCDVCSRPCCLAHARVDYMGDAICEVCIGEAKARARVAAGAYSRPHAGQPRQESRYAPPPTPAVPGAMNRSSALRALKLKSGANWEQIKARYKKLAYEYNADRPQTDAEREKNTARLKKINEAYTFLKAQQEKREAA